MVVIFLSKQEIYYFIQNNAGNQTMKRKQKKRLKGIERMMDISIPKIWLAHVAAICLILVQLVVPLFSTLFVLNYNFFNFFTSSLITRLIQKFM